MLYMCAARDKARRTRVGLMLLIPGLIIKVYDSVVLNIFQNFCVTFQFKINVLTYLYNSIV